MGEVQMAEPTSLPDSLADILPVGMISAAGLAGSAMAAVAWQQLGQDGWEAFHYERISATEFEITGGIAVNTGGNKKFQGAHDTVVIHEVDILAEMRRLLMPQAGQSLPQSPGMLKPATIEPDTSQAQLLKVVFTLPDDEVGRQRILRAFQLQADFFGARVQACSLHDASLLKLD